MPSLLELELVENKCKFLPIKFMWCFVDMSWIEGSLKELDKQELATVDNIGDDILVIEDDNGVHEELFEEEAALC